MNCPTCRQARQGAAPAGSSLATEDILTPLLQTLRAAAFAQAKLEAREFPARRGMTTTAGPGSTIIAMPINRTVTPDDADHHPDGSGRSAERDKLDATDRFSPSSRKRGLRATRRQLSPRDVAPDRQAIERPSVPS